MVSEHHVTGICFLVADIGVGRHRAGSGARRPIKGLGDFLELGGVLAPHFDRVWLSDNLGARSTWVLLAAAAREWKSMSLGSFGSWPYGRNPIDFASMASSIAELMPGRELVLGMSRGNRAVRDALTMRAPVDALREMVLCVRRLQAGEEVQLGDFPVLGEVCGFDPKGRARLEMAPRPVPLFIASTGPKTLEMAGEYADGAIFGTQQPNQSVEAWRRGTYVDVSGLTHLERGRSRSRVGAFHLANSISICVSSDREAAQRFAKREVAAILATKSDAALQAIGVEPERAADVREAFRTGGLDQAVTSISRETVEKLVIVGTPKEVVPGIAEAAAYGHQQGFDEQFLSLPLGPDLREAVGLITGKVVPALRRA
jgi:alkanesulfonate monooxygenase SsuD/methylene tetrahydromethanopterin reductase-like flavin-dependent oxidoreductase (luciferase family)